MVDVHNTCKPLDKETLNMCQARMQDAITDAIQMWWNQLSKDEILEIIRECPEVTADVLREILKNENFSLAFATVFDTVAGRANAKFYDE